MNLDGTLQLIIFVRYPNVAFFVAVLVFRVEELESTVAELEATLQKQQGEALDAVNQWSIMYSQLETLKFELEETLQKQQEESLNAVNEWSTRYSELETIKSKLGETLQKQQEEAQDAVDQLSTRYSELEARKSEVDQELKMALRERDELSEMLESEREFSLKDAVSRIERDFAIYSQLEALKLELEETLQKQQQEETLNANNQWSTTYSDFEMLQSEFEETLQKQQEEAQDAVDQLSTRFSNLETSKSEVEQKLEKVSRERNELSGMLETERKSSGKGVVSRVEHDFATEKADWDTEKERLQSQVDELKEAFSLVSLQNLAAAEDEVTRMKSLRKDAISRVEQDFAAAKAAWDTEKECLQSQVDELNTDALVSSQNLIIAEKEVSRMKSLGKEAVHRVEQDFVAAKAAWDTEKERLQSQVDELKADALVSSQNLVIAEKELSRMKLLREDEVSRVEQDFATAKADRDTAFNLRLMS